MLATGNSEKEMLFLNELEEIIEVLSPATFADIEVKLYKQIARCISGEHFQVAERALHMWGNEILNQIAIDDEEHRRKNSAYCVQRFGQNERG